MSKKLWLKATLLVMTGTTLQFFGNGCWEATIQRILVAVAVD